jgi:glycosyltransferase involved in cell wall biosynthesis
LKSKKILHICSSDVGGAAIASIRIHTALLKLGFDSSILFLTRSSSVPIVNAFTFVVKNNHERPIPPTLTLKNYILEKLTKRYQKSMVKYHNGLNKKQSFHNQNYFFTSPISNYDITQNEVYLQADIIHFHWIAGFVDLPSFFSENTKPVVWTLHDENPILGGFHYASNDVDCPLELVDKNIEFKELKKNVYRTAENLYLVCPSNWLLRKVNTSNFFNNYTSTMVRNTLDTSIFQPRDKNYSRNIFNLPIDKKIFLFVADSLSNERKGFSDILDIACKEKFQDVLFLAIGENQMDYDAKNILFLGRIEDELVLSMVYSSADFFILPSKEDNFPNTILESTCCGTPILAYDISDFRSFFEEYQLGYTTQNNTIASMGELISEVITLNIENNKIAETAHRLFSFENQGKKYVDIYSNL